MRHPEYVSDVVYLDTNDYEVRLGSLADDKPPVYLVVRKKSGVVEFAHEVEAIILEWIEHFEEKNSPKPAAADPVMDDIFQSVN